MSYQDDLLPSFEKALRTCKDDIGSAPTYPSLGNEDEYKQSLKKSKDNAEPLLDYGSKIGTYLLLLWERFGEGALDRGYVEKWIKMIATYHLISDNPYFIRARREELLESITRRYYLLKPFIEILLKQGQPEELVARATAQAEEARKELEPSPEVAVKLRSRVLLQVFGVLCILFACALVTWELYSRGSLDLGLGAVAIMFAIVGALMLFAGSYPEQVNALISAVISFPTK